MSKWSGSCLVKLKLSYPTSVQSGTTRKSSASGRDPLAASSIFRAYVQRRDTTNKLQDPLHAEKTRCYPLVHVGAPWKTRVHGGFHPRWQQAATLSRFPHPRPADQRGLVSLKFYVLHRCIFMSAYFVVDFLTGYQRRNDWPRGLMSSMRYVSDATRDLRYFCLEIIQPGWADEYSAGIGDKRSFR